MIPIRNQAGASVETEIIASGIESIDIPHFLLPFSSPFCSGFPR